MQSAHWVSTQIRNEIILTFAHGIDKNNLPSSSAFTVTLGGNALEIEIDPQGESLSNRQYYIFLVNALFGNTNTVTVAYRDPTVNDDTNAIQSTTGVDAGDFTIDVLGTTNVRRTLFVADATVTEEVGATADFVVTLTPAATETVTVDYATSDGSATAGADYTSTSGTLTFAAGDISKTVSVPVLDDTIEDSGETFTLTLSNIQGGNAQLVDTTATGTILNHEVLPSVSRALAENAAPGTAVGVPVTAGDPDGDVLTYALHGEDAGAFAIEAATGQIRTKAGVFYDYEIKSSYNVVVTATDGNGNTAAIEVAIRLTDEEEVLTASFEEAPAAHGLAPFTVRLRFSEPVGMRWKMLRDHVLQVTNGRVTRALRLDRDRDLRALTGGRLSALRELTIEPSSGGGDVTIALPATADCAAADAVCTTDGRPLSAGARVTVSQGTLPALTAQSSEAPTTHDRSAFELRVDFSWPVTTTPEAVRAHGLAVTDGEVTEAYRVGDEGTTWAFRVLPWSNAGVTVTLPATTDCAAEGAVCTEDGRMLSQGIDWRVEPEDPDAVDAAAPELVRAEVDATRLTLLYNEGLNADSAPDAGAFTVTVAGKTRPLAASEAVAVSGRRVTLALERGIAHDEAATLSYAAPSENPLQDLSGNAAAALSGQSVSTNTPPFTVRFEEGGLPAGHDGVNPLVFRIVFSESPPWTGSNGQNLKTTLRGWALLTRIGGQRIFMKELEWLGERGQRRRWEIRMPPWLTSEADVAKGDFTIELGPTGGCSDKGAVCTGDGRKLSNRLHAVVKGPPVVTVTGAQAPEAADATVDFTVTLGRSASETVTVDYATADDTATAGEDYTETSGTLTFEPEETSKTVSVPVLDDAASEGSERFTLTLSNASGAGAYLEEAGAEGVIDEGEGESDTPPEPLTATFDALPAGHTGEAFTVRLTFSEAFPVTADQVRAGITLTGGALTTVAQTVAGENGSWDLTVTPAGAADAVTVTLTPKESCETANAICTADGRGLAEAVEAEVPGLAPTRVVSASLTSTPGANGTWDTGETVTATVAFNRNVAVQGPPNVMPTLGILLGGTRREADLTTTGSADTFVFSHTVTAADDGAATARIVANGITLNGTIIRDNEGNEAILTFSTGPALSVADAMATEDTDQTAVFVVTLDPAATETVTVDYATSDGTATAPADYTSTSGTLTFAAGETSKTVPVPVTDDTVGDSGETFTLTLSNPSGADAQLADATATGTIANDEAATMPLTAAFRNWPVAHGGSAFTFKLQFSEEFSLSYKTLKDHAIGVTGGTLTGVSRVAQGEDRAWNVTVTPQSGGGDVTVTLAAATDCAAAGAICTADNRALAAAVSETVPRAVPAGTPFKVRLVNVPAEHDGTDDIVFKVVFSKKPKLVYTYVRFRDSTLKIRRGGVTLTPSVRRLNKPHNDRWEVTVAPGGKEDLTVSVGPFAACTDTGAVCTEGGDVLANEGSETILGPPGLSVADAKVYEAPGATVDFPVTLGRASRSTVTVDYATSDGTATEGSDYTSTSGTLTFAAGETEKTVSVPVLNDAHDDDGETFTLTLSNPSGGNAWLRDATATGTIENTDAMPKAWLARFGRTVAEQVLDAVEGRLRAAPRPGIEISLAGQSVGGTPEPEDEDARAALSADAEARSGLEAMSQWLRSETGEEDGRRAGFDARTVTERDLLIGSSFSLTGEAKAGGVVSLWGRGALSRFDGRDGDLSLSGEVTSAMLGADWTRGPDGAGSWTAGLLVSRSEGTGSYRGQGEGKVESSLTGVFPYGRYAVSDRVTLWGTAGYGTGTLTLTPKNAVTGEDDPAMKTDMDLAMGAVGVRGVVVEAPAAGGMEFAVKSDAMAVRTSSEKVQGLAAATANVTRLRLGLEGTWRGIAAGGGELVPRLEVGVRHDGGDAETGFGLDLGGGLSWSHRGSGISAEVSGRGLLTHEAGGFRDRGLSGSLAWDPAPGSDRGPSLTLTQTMGAPASGGMDALLGRETLAGLVANDNGSDELENRRLELRLGYGLSAFGDRFTSTPEIGLGLSNGGRDYSLGWRLGLEQSGPNALELRLEATRRESANDDIDPEHGIGFKVTARW